MGVLPFQLLPPPYNASISASPSSVEGTTINYAVSKSLHNNVSRITGKKFPRRLILQILCLNHVICYASPALAAPVIPDINEPEVIRTFKLPSGVRIQDIVEGEGPEAHSGDLVEFNYVCRRANGYFVYSTVDQFSGESKPVVLPLDENQMIVGLKEVLTGMKLGGKRRALIPPSAGYVNENLKPIPEEFGPRRSLFSHAQEPLVFEVQLLKIWVMTLEPPSVFN
ncbi:PREDICTED: peptidyl-prolyl cis-trans isomerase FKBP16-1, chloroplastic [Lupinus angustifolius]|uniref:peptidyl-prolyl cis-trans isomerase FKBP16-1, chloroplastic n=1 Tax=Lupinus angustifolius TaxID=3871 RepID=UPI00092ECE41|nr:PREDICTED: peptidyl-prolyl cis-trans isomerase FKBP16-1, chloroplastic [Lupinus angustifolius]